MGIKEVSNVASVGLLRALPFLILIYSNAEEDTIIQLLNKVERQGANTYAVDSSTDMGLRVSSLGGYNSSVKIPYFVAFFSCYRIYNRRIKTFEYQSVEGS